MSSVDCSPVTDSSAVLSYMTDRMVNMAWYEWVSRFLMAHQHNWHRWYIQPGRYDWKHDRAIPCRLDWRSSLISRSWWFVLFWYHETPYRATAHRGAVRRNTCLGFNWISRKRWGNVEYVQWGELTTGLNVQLLAVRGAPGAVFRHTGAMLHRHGLKKAKDRHYFPSLAG